MDYAVQLLTIICIFLFGGLWMHDNWGLPMWGVIALFFVGVICAMVVLYKRSVEEAKAEEAKNRKTTEDNSLNDKH